MRFPCTTLLAAVLSLVLASAHAAESPAGPAASDARPESLRLLQRIYHPARPNEPFVDHGAIQLSYDPSTRGVYHGPVSAAFASDADAGDTPLAAYLTAYAASLTAEAQDAASEQQQPVELESALYQLALAHPADTHPSQWHVSSVKACHLPHATAESLVVRLGAGGVPFALDYFVGPVPHDGACPGSAKARRRLMTEVGTRVANTSVVLKGPTHPPLPSLRTPPQLTPEGRVVTPPAEKSFIQKYWMYFAIAFLALAVSGAPAEEGQQGGGGQGR